MWLGWKNFKIRIRSTINTDLRFKWIFWQNEQQKTASIFNCYQFIISLDMFASNIFENKYATEMVVLSNFDRKIDKKNETGKVLKKCGRIVRDSIVLLFLLLLFFFKYSFHSKSTPFVSSYTSISMTFEPNVEPNSSNDVSVNSQLYAINIWLLKLNWMQSLKFQI